MHACCFWLCTCSAPAKSMGCPACEQMFGMLIKQAWASIYSHCGAAQMGVHDEDLVWLAARVRDIRAQSGNSREDGSTAAGKAAQPPEAEKDVQLNIARVGVAAAPDANAFVAPTLSSEGRPV